MEQYWRIFTIEPKAKEDLRFLVSYDLTLRAKRTENIGLLVPFITKDFADDTYIMKVNQEEINVIARDQGQRDRTEGVFGELNSGVYYRVSNENFDEATARLREFCSSLGRR